MPSTPSIPSERTMPKNETPPQMGMGYDDETSDELESDLQKLDATKKLTINRDIQFSRSQPVKKLERYLLATARFPGYEDMVEEEGDSPVPITPYVTVRGVSWYEDVVIKGLYDEDFQASVEAILEERGTLKLMNRDLKEKIDRQLMDFKDDELFRECILMKTKECCTKPRGYMDYIRGNISWDSTKRCLSCPNQDCLIYIYNFYYNFLLHSHPGATVIDKLYMLIVCEARICVISKCLCLEAIRIQDERTGLVEQLLSEIYEDDHQKQRLLPQVSEKYSQMFEKVKKGQVGGTLSPAPDSPPSSDPVKEKALIDLGVAEATFHDAQQAEKAASMEANQKIEVATEATDEAKREEEEANRVRDDALKAKEVAEQQRQLSEQSASEAAQKEESEAALLRESQQNVQRENKEIQGLHALNDDLRKELDASKSENQKILQENQALSKENMKYTQTDEAPVLRARLTEELLAKLSDPEVKVQIQQMISEKNGEYTKSEDPKEVAEAFMDTHFESIHVALSPILSGLNRELFLEDYAKYYKAMQFIEPSLIAQRVYGADPSEGYLDQTFKVIQEYYETHKGQLDYLKEYLKMLPVIVLHSQNIEEYPLQKTGQAITAKTLQLMTPILAKNLDVTAQLVQSMQTHDRLLDARFIGEPYILKKAAEAHSEISEPYKEILKMEATKEKSYKEGLVTGVDEGHCQTMNDNMIQALRHNKPIPITSKDMMFLTQCQTQKKLPRDTDNLP